MLPTVVATCGAMVWFYLEAVQAISELDIPPTCSHLTSARWVTSRSFLVEI